jgi:hypothetical protein
MARRRTWREAGCYMHRTRKPHAPIGLPIIGRHTAYVGETGSRYHRDRQHRFGGGTYGATAKVYADLDLKIYPLPCLWPNWKAARKVQEWLYIKALFPVYNVQHNGTNPRRIKPRVAESQRWERDKQRELGLRTLNLGRVAVRWSVNAVLLYLAITVLLHVIN